MGDSMWEEIGEAEQDRESERGSLRRSGKSEADIERIPHLRVGGAPGREILQREERREEKVETVADKTCNEYENAPAEVPTKMRRPLGFDLTYDEAMFWAVRFGDVRRKSWAEGERHQVGRKLTEDDRRAKDWEHWDTVELGKVDGRVMKTWTGGMELALQSTPKLGQQFMVYEVGEEVEDPHTHENLGALEMLHGFGRVIGISPVVLKGEFRGVKVGDFVREVQEPVAIKRDKEILRHPTQVTGSGHTAPVVAVDMAKCPDCHAELTVKITNSANAPMKVEIANVEDPMWAKLYWEKDSNTAAYIKLTIKDAAIEGRLRKDDGSIEMRRKGDIAAPDWLPKALRQAGGAT